MLKKIHAEINETRDTNAVYLFSLYSESESA